MYWPREKWLGNLLVRQRANKGETLNLCFSATQGLSVRSVAMRSLTDLLDHLGHSVKGHDVAISDLVGETGPHSFAALSLVYADLDLSRE